MCGGWGGWVFGGEEIRNPKSEIRKKCGSRLTACRLGEPIFVVPFPNLVGVIGEGKVQRPLKQVVGDLLAW